MSTRLVQQIATCSFSRQNWYHFIETCRFARGNLVRSVIYPACYSKDTIWSPRLHWSSPGDNLLKKNASHHQGLDFEVLSCKVPAYIMFLDRSHFYTLHDLINHYVRNIWKHWTYKCVSVIGCRVYAQDFVHSLNYISFMKCLVLKSFILAVSILMIARLYVQFLLSSMNHWLSFRDWSWSNGMRCMFWSILIRTLATRSLV